MVTKTTEYYIQVKCPLCKKIRTELSEVRSEKLHFIYCAVCRPLISKRLSATKK